MRIVMFYHSLVSDWNHGNAHFLRGVVSELLAGGHDVRVYEPRDAWSVQNLVAEHGTAAIADFHRAYPQLRSAQYDLATLDLDTVLDGAGLVLVHEWNEPSLVTRIGAHRESNRSYTLLFHDTHHRAVTSPHEMERYDLRGYDGVLAFGDVIRDIYIAQAWTERAWTWHEAADARVFTPLPDIEPDADLVWIGNWGDDERSRELVEYLIDPVRQLGLSAAVHGVRYPDDAKALLAEAGIDYRGWVANYRAPEVFARHRVTVHVPRRPYVRALPGIPTIRMFEALACGIPLVSAPWSDAEHLFTPGTDYLVASSGEQMRRHLRDLLSDPSYAGAVAAAGRRTVLERHTCAHRVDQLAAIVDEIQAGSGLTAGLTQTVGAV
jgi:spore maturation protein CgeB